MFDIQDFVVTNWVALVSVVIASGSFVYTILVERRRSKKELVEKVRPYLTTLRRQLEGLDRRTLTSSPTIHGGLVGIKYDYERLVKKESLDFTLSRVAGSIKEILDIIIAKVTKAEKTLQPQWDTHTEDWQKMGELLKSENFFADETSKLKFLVLEWLKRHP